MPKEPKKKHGGARPGAGRKPTGARKLLVAARVPQDSANRIYTAAAERNPAEPSRAVGDVLHDLAQKHLPPATRLHPELSQANVKGQP